MQTLTMKITVELTVTVNRDLYPEDWSTARILKEEQDTFKQHPEFLQDLFDEDNFTVKVTKEK